MLLLAHTDTAGNPAVNVPLASARAKVVRDTLIGEGGIATTRAPP
jgi:outer membrane protein OmpA-like peptidoglycan-associated protein